MALMKSKEVPKDAVPLTELEATSYIWDIIIGWENLSDTWALRYGPMFLGSMSALSGVLINRHYRFKLKLGTYGYLSSVIPISFMPGILTALFHRYLVSTDMLLMKNDTCPICYEMRANAIQLGLGLAYPMVLGPASALMFANRGNTYRVPQFTEGPKKMISFLRKITKPFHGVIASLAVAQFVASSVITYYEMKNNLTVRRKMLEKENEILERQGYGSNM